MSLNPTHANKRKHPRKIDTQTLTLKVDKQKHNWQKLIFVMSHENLS